jgi:hypothetical protein
MIAGAEVRLGETAETCCRRRPFAPYLPISGLRRRSVHAIGAIFRAGRRQTVRFERLVHHSRDTGLTAPWARSRRKSRLGVRHAGTDDLRELPASRRLLRRPGPRARVRRPAAGHSRRMLGLAAARQCATVGPGSGAVQSGPPAVRAPVFQRKRPPAGLVVRLRIPVAVLDRVSPRAGPNPGSRRTRRASRSRTHAAKVASRREWVRARSARPLGSGRKRARRMGSLLSLEIDFDARDVRYWCRRSPSGGTAGCPTRRTSSSRSSRRRKSWSQPSRSRHSVSSATD